MIPIFIGYDPREAIAYHVCTNSIIRRSSQPVALNPLALNVLKGYDEKILTVVILLYIRDF